MFRRILAAGFLAALGLAVLLTGGTPASAQPSAAFTPAQRDEIVAIVRSAMKTDPSILRDAITALQQEDGAQQEAAARVAIDHAAPALKATPGDPVAGNPQGDVTVVEFYDVRCPYCRRMLPVDAALLKAEPGVRLLYKDIPILGPASVLGARAELAATRQGGYLRLRQAIMTGTPNITEASLKESAAQAGLDWPQLEHDMAAPDIQTRIDANLELARQLDVHGTPAYVIGQQLIPGAADLDALRAAVAAARH